MQYKVKNTSTLNERANSLFGKAAMALEYALFKTGPLTMPPSQLGAFGKSDPSQPTANIEWHVQPLSLDKFGDPLHTFPAITPSVCNLRPRSRGWVASRRPIRLPIPRSSSTISASPRSAHRRRRHAVHAAHHGGEGAGAIRAGRVPARRCRAVRRRTGESRRRAGYDDFHPVGTCRMGRDEVAVVDDRLRVRGVTDLRVIDASIMPRITSGNTNAPAYMIAEKGSVMVLEDRRS